jgi:hypothetical protein
VSRASRRARTALLLLTAAAGTGCDYFRDSPEQEVANRRWRECTSGLHDVKLDRVDVDGRIRFSYSTLAGRNQVVACLKEAEAAGGTSLPEAVPADAAGK